MPGWRPGSTGWSRGDSCLRGLAGYRTIRITHRRLDEEAETIAPQIRGLLEAPLPPAQAPS